METILANMRGRARVATENGREYRVASASIIVPGVLNGSKGALHYPPEEVQANPGVWNNVDLVVYHPQVNGVHVSAKDRSVPRESFIGFTRNDKFEGGKRRVEAWFDVQAVKNYDAVLRSQGKPEIYPRLERGEPIELSTGLFTDNEARSGSYNGKGFTHVARNYRPDHLAILPDQKGACSLDDGCGVFNYENDGGQTGPEHTCGCAHMGCEKCVTDEMEATDNTDYDLECVDNAFCPTGKDGGQDNSCGSDEGGGGGSDSQSGRYLSMDEAKSNAKKGDTPFIVRDKKGKTVGLTHDEKFAAAEAKRTGGDYDFSKWKKTKRVNNVAPNQPRSKNTGRLKHMGAGTGEGDVYAAAQAGYVALTDKDRMLGKASDGTDLVTPAWVADPVVWTKARDAATKGGYQEDEYWAVSAHIYQHLGGQVNDVEVTPDAPNTNAFCPTGKDGGQDNSCSSGDGGGGSGKDLSDLPAQPGAKVKVGKGIGSKLEGKTVEVVKGPYKVGGNTGVYKVKDSSTGREEEIHGSRLTHNTTGVPDMTKPQIVTWLTTNCDCWKGAGKVLNTMDEPQLNKLKANADKTKTLELTANAFVQVARKLGAPGDLEINAMPAYMEKKMAEKEEEVASADENAGGSTDPKPKTEEEITAEDDVPPPVKNNRGNVLPAKKPTANGAPKKMTIQEWLGQMPPEAQPVWNTAVELNNSVKQAASAKLKGLIANEGDPRRKHRMQLALNSGDVAKMQEVIELVGPTQNANSAQAREQVALYFPGLFGDQSPVQNRAATDGEDVLDLPTINQDEWNQQAALPKRAVA
jgi:hypothetical protein